ncbi:carboxypeptidase-like regulatory domain-containing protein [Christiangramia sediminis]|uniref:Carboxypeptidase-like regulatory domain-containing protein n=1 Tax=Christiangramia sediminis TaxID=2881336 RepID=A0A9X1LIP7_9FLAO|nr:carboxypeptidase-like regulatory domain-containing protein [Christiangramia sediminis]MCB7481126.1 carboxypeptidase-like regulatory domain-containing protein [Christiangramia sediminis]
MKLKFINIIKSLSLFCLLFLFTYNSFAQESSVLKGKIDANSADIEKIHVINLNLEKGAVTNANGEFQILARENDSLYVSSVQFENKTVVVTRKMLESRSLLISLQNKMNELAEIVIDDIKLSGYLANDIGKISVTQVETKNRLQNDLNTFIEKDKKLSPYGKPNLNGGIRLDKIAGAVMNKLSENSDKPVYYSPKELANKSIQIVGHEFFREDLNLKDNEICNFVYFCTEDTRFKRLVINSNAFVLIEYFQTKIEDFKERRGSALNAPVQIPG